LKIERRKRAYNQKRRVVEEKGGRIWGVYRSLRKALRRTFDLAWRKGAFSRTRKENKRERKFQGKLGDSEKEEGRYRIGGKWD